MPEQIYTFSDEELARMFKSGEMRLLTVPIEEPSPAEVLGIDLIKEWEKQATKLADLFALELNQSKDQYIKGLPHFFPQPQNYKGRFEIPLIVQVPTRKLTLGKMLQIVGVDCAFDIDRVEDWEGDPGNFKTPNSPYATWLYDGDMNQGKTIAEVREGLATDERGGTLLDGLALFIQNPDILKSHYLDLSGSQIGLDRAPSLYLSGNQPSLYHYSVGDADPLFGSVVAGRKIKT